MYSDFSMPVEKVLNVGINATLSDFYLFLILGLMFVFEDSVVVQIIITGLKQSQRQ